MQMRTLRVTLCSPSSATRAGLRVLLGEEVAIVAESARLLSAVHTDADLIVLDADALEETNLEGCAVLLLSDDPAQIHLLRRLAPHPWGAVSADAEPSALRAAARAVSEGFVVLPGDVALLEPVRVVDDLEPLTPRELEVLRLLVEGLPNKRIGLELGIAESTVKYHLEGIYAKLNVRSRSQALRTALERGLVLL
jgi:two-component system, NarL family, nitrate/nitrite response regulator NarL